MTSGLSFPNSSPLLHIWWEARRTKRRGWAPDERFAHGFSAIAVSTSMMLVMILLLAMIQMRIKKKVNDGSDNHYAFAGTVTAAAAE